MLFQFALIFVFATVTFGGDQSPPKDPAACEDKDTALCGQLRLFCDDGWFRNQRHVIAKRHNRGNRRRSGGKKRGGMHIRGPGGSIDMGNNGMDIDGPFGGMGIHTGGMWKGMGHGGGGMDWGKFDHGSGMMGGGHDMDWGNFGGGGHDMGWTNWGSHGSHQGSGEWGGPPPRRPRPRPRRPRPRPQRPQEPEYCIGCETDMEMMTEMTRVFCPNTCGMCAQPDWPDISDKCREKIAKMKKDMEDQDQFS